MISAEIDEISAILFIFVNKEKFRTKSLKKVFGEFFWRPKIFILKMVHYKKSSGTFGVSSPKL